MGKLDNISFFVYQLPNKKIGFTSMDYKRQLTMDEMKNINYENYKFITCEVSEESFFKSSQSIIDFLESR